MHPILEIIFENLSLGNDLKLVSVGMNINTIYY